MVEIIPAILTSSLDEAKDLLKKAEGKVKRAQIDIIDGKFADNKTIDPDSLEEVTTSLLLDFHLMVVEPTKWIEKCAKAGADRIIGQIEKMSDQVGFVGEVTKRGLSVGLAIDLETPVTSLDPVVLNNLDVVLVMSVKAGFGGQEFDDKALEKIKQLDEIRVRDDTPFRICGDGGISLKNIKKEKVARVDEVAIGKRLFKGDFAQNVDKFTKAQY